MTLWEKRLCLARKQLITVANTPDVPDFMLMEHCRMFLNAYHQGPWRAIFALTKYELWSLWGSYGWPKWEWIRVKVLRREPDPVLSIARRVAEAQDREARTRILDALDQGRAIDQAIDATTEEAIAHGGKLPDEEDEV